MPDSNVGINEPAAVDVDKRLDTNTVDRGAGVVHRERVLVAKAADSVADVDWAADQLVPFSFDYIACSYVDGPRGKLISQAVYRQGGAVGVIVATVDVAYVAGTEDILTVTRS
jgi:hypothetical protein